MSGMPANLGLFTTVCNFEESEKNAVYGKLLLLLDCKWVVKLVAAVIQYGTTKNIHKQIHVTTNDTYHTGQHNCWVNLLK
jgi:hypothetical protein